MIQSERLKIVMNTLQDLDIKSTYENMTKLVGCLRELDNIYGEMVETEQRRADEEHNEKPPEQKE